MHLAVPYTKGWCRMLSMRKRLLGWLTSVCLCAEDMCQLTISSNCYTAFVARSSISKKGLPKACNLLLDSSCAKLHFRPCTLHMLWQISSMCVTIRQSRQYLLLHHVLAHPAQRSTSVCHDTDKQPCNEVICMTPS